MSRSRLLRPEAAQPDRPCPGRPAPRRADRGRDPDQVAQPSSGSPIPDRGHLDRRSRRAATRSAAAPAAQRQPQPPPETIDHRAPLVHTPVHRARGRHQPPATRSSPATTVGTGDTVDPRSPATAAANPVRRAAADRSVEPAPAALPAVGAAAERDGRVQVRVTIGPDGRVIEVALLSATSDAFWQVTGSRRYPLALPPGDGRRPPGRGQQVMSIIFRLDQG